VCHEKSPKVSEEFATQGKKEEDLAPFAYLYISDLATDFERDSGFLSILRIIELKERA
tara:strand:+ start:70 stop:243 length:174 start_codon:yes stop_codon:yes gene_type:complete